MGRWLTHGPVYLCPTEKYCFWIPDGLHGWETTDCPVSELGHRISPMTTLWYVNLGPLYRRHEFIKSARLLLQSKGTADASTPRVHLCTSAQKVNELLQVEQCKSYREGLDILNASHHPHRQQHLFSVAVKHTQKLHTPEAKKRRNATRIASPIISQEEQEIDAADVKKRGKSAKQTSATAKEQELDAAQARKFAKRIALGVAPMLGERVHELDSLEGKKQR